MTANKVIKLALLVLLIAWVAYVTYFGFIYGGKSPEKAHEQWGLLGDFLGGTLNPILTFLTIVILIKSLSIQREEGEKLQQFEKVRAFETHFFNMINSQKVLFNNFRLSFEIAGEEVVKHSGEAVIMLEDVLVHLKDSGKSDEDITRLLVQLDNEDSIYSAIRTFSVITKLIDRKLSEDNGFTVLDRKEYLEILLNYTDFALLRLVLVSIKYMDNSQLSALKESREFLEVLNDIGVSSYLDNV